LVTAKLAEITELAVQIAEDFRGVGPTLTSQSEFDHLLLTAHSRINRADAQPVDQE
jgi:thymidylate synthase ThyX